jgi:hypothetical protein
MAETTGPVSKGDLDAQVDAGSDAEPLIVDVGRKRRKLVKQLRQGRGKLLADVMRCVQELKDSGAITGGAQPVIVVVTERPKKPASILW